MSDPFIRLVGSWVMCIWPGVSANLNTPYTMENRLLASFASCLFALVGASTASAEIEFRIDTLTADEFTLTIFGGPESAFAGSPTNGVVYLDFSPGPGFEWIVSTGSPILEVVTGGITNLGTTIEPLIYDGADGDGIYVEGASNFVTGEHFLVDTQVRWTGTNLFNLDALAGQSIFAYWGTNAALEIATGVLQSEVQAVAVPEPSAFAALAGVTVLGLAASRRRRAGVNAVK